ncbi:hypothetical protein D5086_010895 [Populus alba]|uniref:Uncharacterized protein n=1 Tax=Populus alba TaxID=43335 RepID=A0ACC4CBV0_POPAL
MVPPNVMPGMLKTASDMMSKMSPEKLQKMFEMASSSRGNVNRNDGISGTSSSSFPASTSDMQEQMRDQMKDPAMQQIFTSMMKNMSTEMMTNMRSKEKLKVQRRHKMLMQRLQIKCLYSLRCLCRLAEPAAVHALLTAADDGDEEEL